MNDLESGGSRTAVNSRGQHHAPAHMDVGPDSQQLHSTAPTGQPPAPHFARPSQPALQLAPVQPAPAQAVPPQPAVPQPNPNYHVPTPQPVPTAPILPHVVQPPHNIAPQPTAQVHSGVTAPPIPAQPNTSQPQQSTNLPFRFDLQDPPLPYVFGSAANASDTAPRLGKRNRPVDEDPKKIRVIRHPSVSIKSSVLNLF